MHAIILAGGKGKRLKPYTSVLPKPLMPIGEYPILDILLRQLKRHGFTRVTLAVGHLGSLIRAYCGDGARWGLAIDYSFEDKPLGTAGPLSLVEGFDSTAVVMNGDLLTDVDFRRLVDFHRQRADLVTIGMYRREEQIELGVLKADESHIVTDYIEKPFHHCLVSMGVYVLEPGVRGFLEKGTYTDFPDLIRLLIRTNHKVIGYLHEGFWLDIGRPDDYERALNSFETIRGLLLPGNE